MDLKSKNKIETAFSMASMTDMVFLLLIFFMLTASFVTPSGLPVNLPKSKASNIVMQKVSVTITSNLVYFVNDQRVPYSEIERALKSELKEKEGVVVLHVDETVDTKYLIEVAGIAASLNAKVTIATKPD